MTRFAFVALVATGCAAVAVLSVPQVRKLRTLREELVRTKAQEQYALDDKDRMEQELDALRNDPDYLELRARDLLDLHRPGERIYRIRRD